MAEKNNFEEPFQNNNNQGTNEYNLPEPFQNNLESNEYNLPEPFKDNQLLNENNIPGPYQNNIQGVYQNNNSGPNQNNIPGDYQNNNLDNNLNQENENKELKNKINNSSIIIGIIMTLLYIAEITLEITALPSIRKAQKYDKGSFMYVSLTAIYCIFVYPPLIILSLCVLSFTCCVKYPNPRTAFSISFTICLCLVKGLIMIKFFNEDSGKVANFGIALEILNGCMFIISISYNITVYYLLKNNNN